MNISKEMTVLVCYNLINELKIIGSKYIQRWSILLAMIKHVDGKGLDIIV
jgi:hypothetical protein